MWIMREIILTLILRVHVTKGVKMNVALNKPASMSSRYGGFLPAGGAVDGIITTVPLNIIHTNPGESSAWWQVDLQTTVKDADVEIYFRTDYKVRRNGVKLYTFPSSSTPRTSYRLCHTVRGRNDGTDIPDVVSVVCRGVWRYLHVFTQTNDAILDFGEIRVLVCETGTYGPNCTNLCNSRHCAGDSTVCNQATGFCIEGCLVGWRGTDCTQDCSTSNKYGENCAKSCSSRQCIVTSSSCERAEGACLPAWCKPGYRGTDCSDSCTLGTYGINCSNECENRQCRTTSAVCDPETGQCPEDGCEDGWMGVDCATHDASFTPVSPPGIDAWAVVAGILIVVVVILVVVLAIVLFRLRRLQCASQQLSKASNRPVEMNGQTKVSTLHSQRSSLYAQLDAETRGNAYETIQK